MSSNVAAFDIAFYSGCIRQVARKGKFASKIFSHSKPPRDSTLKGTVNIKFIQEVTVNLNLALRRYV